MNLKARYGQTYRIAREEGADRSNAAGFTISCRRGHHIYVHSQKLLGVATNGRGPIVKRLSAWQRAKLRPRRRGDGDPAPTSISVNPSNGHQDAVDFDAPAFPFGIPVDELAAWCRIGFGRRGMEISRLVLWFWGCHNLPCGPT
jgi:hypothetical protein